MINEKNKFLTVSWLSGVLSAEIFISTGEWGVQMPPLTAENSHLLRSGSQGVALVIETFSSSLAICAGEFTGHRSIPHTKASDAELWCFLWSAPE